MQRVFPNWFVQSLKYSAWAPIAVFLFHVASSKVLGLYRLIPYFDTPMHILGGVAIAYFFHVASICGSSTGLLGPYHRLTHFLLVFGWTTTAAVIWEFAEFLSDRYFGTHMQDGDLNDTLKDILMGMLGGTIWLAIDASRRRRP